VLAAARELFRSEGVGVPLDAIARRAGVGAGTVHRHFPTKEALLAEIVVEDLERRVAAVRERPADTDPGVALFALLEGLLDDGLANAALKAALVETDADLAVRATAATELQELLSELLAAAQRAGAVRTDVDTGDLKAVLVAALAARSGLAEDDLVVRVRAAVVNSALRVAVEQHALRGPANADGEALVRTVHAALRVAAEGLPD
jgi:AcrR family transcriptional regulator